jgi:hypothetical protein
VSTVIVHFSTARSFAVVLLASLLLLIYMMLMALSLALLLLLAAADRPDVASTVVAGLPAVLDALMYLIGVAT